MLRFALSFSLVVLLGLPARAEDASPILGNAKCQALCSEGQTLKVDKKYNEALAKFRAAAQADPKASMPLSLMASLFLGASGMTDPKNVEPYRNQARALAQEALAKQSGDPLALEVLRDLSGETRTHDATKSPEALQAYNEAEDWFGKGDYRKALVKYLAAAKADPSFAKAMLYAGDCHFALKAYAEAETCYARATELDPMDAQGWRFLADARAALGRPREEVKDALVRSIAAQPNYLPAWGSFESLRKAEGTALRVFRPALAASVTRDPKSGNRVLNLEERFSKGKDNLDGAIWIAFGAGQITALSEAEKQGAPPPTAFAQVLSGWKTAFLVLAGNGGKLPTDATLLQFKAFADAGHLETGVFLFLYREAYRDEFEAFKRKNPKAIATFLEVFPLRPPAK